MIARRIVSAAAFCVISATALAEFPGPPPLNPAGGFNGSFDYPYFGPPYTGGTVGCFAIPLMEDVNGWEGVVDHPGAEDECYQCTFPGNPDCQYPPGNPCGACPSPVVCPDCAPGWSQPFGWGAGAKWRISVNQPGQVGLAHLYFDSRDCTEIGSNLAFGWWPPEVDESGNPPTVGGGSAGDLFVTFDVMLGADIPMDSFLRMTLVTPVDHPQGLKFGLESNAAYPLWTETDFFDQSKVALSNLVGPEANTHPWLTARNAYIPQGDFTDWEVKADELKPGVWKTYSFHISERIRDSWADVALQYGDPALTIEDYVVRGMYIAIEFEEGAFGEVWVDNWHITRGEPRYRDFASQWTGSELQQPPTPTTSMQTVSGHPLKYAFDVDDTEADAPNPNDSNGFIGTQSSISLYSPATITVEFPAAQWVNTLRLVTPPQFYIRDAYLTYRDPHTGSWYPVPVLSFSNNALEVREFCFSAIETDAVRLAVTKVKDLGGISELRPSTEPTVKPLPVGDSQRLVEKSATLKLNSMNVFYDPDQTKLGVVSRSSVGATISGPASSPVDPLSRAIDGSLSSVGQSQSIASETNPVNITIDFGSYRRIDTMTMRTTKESPVRDFKLYPWNANGTNPLQTPIAVVQDCGHVTQANGDLDSAVHFSSLMTRKVTVSITRCTYEQFPDTHPGVFFDQWPTFREIGFSRSGYDAHSAYEDPSDPRKEFIDDFATAPETVVEPPGDPTYWFVENPATNLNDGNPGTVAISAHPPLASDPLEVDFDLGVYREIDHFEFGSDVDLPGRCQDFEIWGYGPNNAGVHSWRLLHAMTGNRIAIRGIDLPRTLCNKVRFKVTRFEDVHGHPVNAHFRHINIYNFEASFRDTHEPTWNLF